ncbi:hypothetical protein KUCAC02_015575 [Chaenocephalus aceratus]|uniref:Uncharacterized protein n=1 Tax=Chaenocephalus aceratus TaxID=36190 RepID=A0ACB9XZ59_CHAAC|nr:hypothetical protein KUCAC02_015575 [Chaenocephalus aceratus]
MVLFLVVDRLMLVRAPTGAVDPGHYSECQPIRYIVSLSQTCRLATDTYLVNDDPSRGPGMPECFLVSDTYRAASTTCLTHLAC